MNLELLKLAFARRHSNPRCCGAVSWPPHQRWPAGGQVRRPAHNCEQAGFRILLWEAPPKA